MATLQTGFISEFQAAFRERFGHTVDWRGGQKLNNVAALPANPDVRRGGLSKPNERFELGDLRGDVAGHTVIVEFESDAISIQNLVKYWPYVLGHLSERPSSPILLCHFSNWVSWGAVRDLWCWCRDRMRETPDRLVEFDAQQFDHSGKPHDRSDAGIEACLTWLSDVIA